MVTLRERPSREIEDFFIPTERRSSLRSQTYSSPTSTANHLSSALYIGSDQSPSRKRGKVVYMDGGGPESESEIHPSPTKRPRANKARAYKARLSYPSPPSEVESIKTPSVKSEAMPGTVLLDLPLEVSSNALDLTHPRSATACWKTPICATMNMFAFVYYFSCLYMPIRFCC
jgi:hypothetical protein